MSVPATLTYTVSTLSLFGSLSLIGCYFFLGESGGSCRKLIFYLSIADLFQSLFFLGNLHVYNGVGCKLLAIFGIFAAVSTFLWTVLIAHFIWISVLLPAEMPEKHPIYYHAIAWGVPSGIIVSLLLYSVIWSENHSPIEIFGPDASVGWCFIGAEYIWARVLSIYIPLIVCWLLTCLFVFSARSKLLKILKLQEMQVMAFESERNNPLPEMIARLTLIPLLFIFLRVWGAIYRVWWVAVALRDDSISSNAYFDTHHEWLQDLTSFGDAAQGFTNFVIFVILTRSVRQKIWARFLRLCCGVQESDSHHESFHHVVLKYGSIEDTRFQSPPIQGQIFE